MKPLLKTPAFLICFFLIFSVQLFAEDDGGDDGEESNKEIKCEITGDEVILIDKTATYTADVTITKGERAEGGSSFEWSNPSGEKGATITYSDTASIKSVLLSCTGIDGKARASGKKTIHIIDPVVVKIVARCNHASTTYNGNDKAEEFEGHKTTFYNLPTKEGQEQALVIFRNEVYNANGSINNFEIDLTALFDSASEVPHNILDESWSKFSGPASGYLDKNNTYNVKFKNPKIGGLYKVRFNFLKKKSSGANILLPLAGADIKDWLVKELKKVPAWAKLHKEATEEDNESRFKWLYKKKVLGVWVKIANNEFDYKLAPKDVTSESPSRPFNPDINDRNILYTYVTVNGIVLSGSKINLILYTVFGREWEYSTKKLKETAEDHQQRTAGHADSPSSQAAMQLGGEIYDELKKNPTSNLSKLLTKKRLKELVDPDYWYEEKVWPSQNPAHEPNSILKRPNLSTTIF